MVLWKQTNDRLKKRIANPSKVKETKRKRAIGTDIDLFV